jgi:CDP-glucose 4,6-dehydratase
MDVDFWKGKRVLLTGHTGFKGGWLSLWMQSMGANVTGYALQPPTQPSLFEVARVGDGMRSHIADIRDLDRLAAVMRETQPEIVIHMAAQPLVRYSYVNPVETYATNVMGTVNLLEAVRQVGSVKVVINITSDKCYENREWIWGYRENDPMGGYDPYSSSKGCAELVASAYRNSFFNPQDYTNHGVAVASVRAGNVIGGGDWAADRLIPDMLRAIEAGQPVVIRSPNAIRPWQHVLEPLKGYLSLAEKMWENGPEFSEGWNFGPNDDDAKPVEWIINKMTRQWGEGATWKMDEREHPHEAHYLKLDCSKAKSRLNWRPRWNIEQALERIIAWHRSYLAGENMREVTQAQILDYENMQMSKVS